MKIRTLLLAIAALGIASVAIWSTARESPSARASVISDGGNIIAFWPDGRRGQLTDSGKDVSPSLSPDGKLVVFTRATQGCLVFTGFGEEEANELWLVDIDGANERLLLRGESRGDRLGERRCDDINGGLFNPKFSPDGKTVYFDGYCAAVHGAVYAVGVQGGSARCLGSSLGESLVLYDTEYAGHLIVAKHRYMEEGGSYNWCYLVAPEGEELAALGDCDWALDDAPGRRKLFDDWLQGGKSSPPTPR